jgi:hypothetical protein
LDDAEIDRSGNNDHVEKLLEFIQREREIEKYDAGGLKLEACKLYKAFSTQRGRLTGMSFRSWDLYEYLLLETTTKHDAICVILVTQTVRKNILHKSAVFGDNYKLTNIRLYLTSETCPYDDLNLDFDRRN